MNPIMLKPVTENEDGTPLHFASCASCGARWAGPFPTRPEALAVATGANDSPFYDIPRSLRSGPCCVAEPVEAWEQQGAGPLVVPVVAPVNRGTDGRGPRVPLAGFVAGGFSAAVFVGWLFWQFARAVWAFGRGVVSLGAWMLPIGIAVIGVVAGVSAVLPPVSVTYADVALWLAVPAVLVVVGVLVWRWTRPGAVPTVERPEDTTTVKNLGTIYSTPLRTPPGASSVTPVSKTPADERPKG